MTSKHVPKSFHQQNNGNYNKRKKEHITCLRGDYTEFKAKEKVAKHILAHVGFHGSVEDIEELNTALEKLTCWDAWFQLERFSGNFELEVTKVNAKSVTVEIKYDGVKKAEATEASVFLAKQTAAVQVLRSEEFKDKYHRYISTDKRKNLDEELAFSELGEDRSENDAFQKFVKENHLGKFAVYGKIRGETGTARVRFERDDSEFKAWFQTSGVAEDQEKAAKIAMAKLKKLTVEREVAKRKAQTSGVSARVESNLDPISFCTQFAQVEGGALLFTETAVCADGAFEYMASYEQYSFSAQAPNKKQAKNAAASLLAQQLRDDYPNWEESRKNKKNVKRKKK